MNIYALDQDPRRAAQYHVDRHVSKQILETVQILYMAHRMLDGLLTTMARVPMTDNMRVPDRMQHHVCVKWARESSDNYRWAYYLFDDLCEEYSMRFKKEHPYVHLKRELHTRPLNMPMSSMTPWAQAMPTQYRRADSIESYRLFYVHEKRHIAQWSRPSIVPTWWNQLSTREKLNEQQRA